MADPIKSQNKPPKIGVVHLVRRHNDIIHFKNFIESYRKHDAGIDHELIILMVAFWGRSNAKKKVDEILGSIPHKKIFFLDWGFDIRPYSWVMRHVNCDYFLFLNSFSVLLTDSWFKKMYDNLIQPGVGIVGVGANNLSSERLWDSNLKKTPFWSFKKIIFWALRLRGRLILPRFPNYYIRTNGFMISKKVADQIQMRLVLFKFQAFWFECGRNSLTRQIMKLGLKPLVIDNKGHGFEKESWHKSHTYGWAKQQGLIVSDNRTRLFESRSDTEKRAYEFLIWGKTSDESSN